jgi:hypothetical protein
MSAGEDLHAVVAVLQDAARVVSGVADELREVQWGAPVRAAGESLPGSRLAASAEEVATAWSAAGDTAAADLTAHATALTQAAQHYRVVELDNADHLRSAGDGAV